MTTTKDDDAQGRDEQRVAEIRAKHAPFDFGMRHPISGKWSSRVSCKGCHRPWPCEPAELLARLGALEAERDEWRAKAEQQAQLKADFRAAYQAAQQAGYDMEALRDRAEAERDDALARLAAAEAANARAADRIMQDVLDLDPDDPEHPDTICISYDALVVVLENALRGADAALAGSREQAATTEGE